jgi:uncharacterized MAPEG superfamily protein
MAVLHHLWIWADLILISPYRWLENPVAGFLLGTLVLSLWCVLVGKMTGLVVGMINRFHMGSLERETVKMHNLSLKAILSRDKASYTACNREANEAFGRYFFAQLAAGAATLWPVPFALAWMETRFREVTFPLSYPLSLITPAAGHLGIFLLWYVLLRMLLKNLSPEFHAVRTATAREPREKMMTLADLGRDQD